MLKTFKNLLLVLVAAALLGGCLLAGCASAPPPNPLSFNNHALAATDGAKTILSGPAEQEAIARFETFSGDLSAANITNNIRRVYADGIYFKDPFKEIHGVADFETYLLRDSASVAQYHLDWADVARSEGDYYFRWVMTVKLKRDGRSKPPSQTGGISEIRFGPDGKVLYEEDYFDAGAFLYERLPLLGGEIRFIKKRM